MGRARSRKAAPPPISPQQQFIAQMGNLRTATKEDIYQVAGSDEDRARRQTGDVGIIEHTTDAMVTMWKPLNNGFGDYLPRPIPVSNIKMCFDNGWQAVCPKCGTADCSEDPNSCAGRGLTMYRLCPECNKRVYDNKFAQLDAIAEMLDADPEAEAERAEQEDLALIKDDAYLASTPESRTKARLDRHMLAYHPEEAASRGLFPQTPRDPTDQRIGR